MSSLSSNLVLKVIQQDDAFCCWVCHGRFHGTLQKEYSGTFYGLLSGLYEEMPTNTQVQSDIVTHQTFFYNLLLFYSYQVNQPRGQCHQHIAKSKNPLAFCVWQKRCQFSFINVFCPNNQWVENNPSNICIFPTNICIFIASSPHGTTLTAFADVDSDVEGC